MAVRYVYRKLHEVMALVWPRPDQVNVQHPEALCPCQCQDPAFFSLVWVLSNKMKMFILRLGSFIHEILNQKKGLSFCHSGLLGEGGGGERRDLLGEFLSKNITYEKRPGGCPAREAGLQPLSPRPWKNSRASLNRIWGQWGRAAGRVASLKPHVWFWLDHLN